jgi:hypothetical protein
MEAKRGWVISKSSLRVIYLTSMVALMGLGFGVDSIKLAVSIKFYSCMER